MFLMICVQSKHADQCVKSASFNNRASGKYLRIDKHVTAREDIGHNLYMITRTDFMKRSQFFLYDPSSRRFLCLNANRAKLIGKKIIDDNSVDYCTFQEKVVDKIYTEYMVPISNYTMAFNKKGTLSRGGKIRHAKKNHFLSNVSVDCHLPKFCLHMKKLVGRDRKLATEIKDICGNWIAK